MSYPANIGTKIPNTHLYKPYDPKTGNYNPNSIRIESSTIYQGDNGIIANAFIKKGTRVSTYDGDLYLLTSEQRKIWFSTYSLYSHARVICGGSGNACKVIAGIKSDTQNRGKASLINDPVNYFALPNTELINPKTITGQEYCALVTTRDIAPGEELFLKYSNQFFPDPDHNIRLKKSSIDNLMQGGAYDDETVCLYLNSNRIRIPKWKEMRLETWTDSCTKTVYHEHFMPPKVQGHPAQLKINEVRAESKILMRFFWTKPLARYALIKERFAPPETVTRETLQLLNPNNAIYRRLLVAYVQASNARDITEIQHNLNAQQLAVPNTTHASPWRLPDIKNLLTIKLYKSDQRAAVRSEKSMEIIFEHLWFTRNDREEPLPIQKRKISKIETLYDLFHRKRQKSNHYNNTLYSHDAS